MTMRGSKGERQIPKNDWVINSRKKPFVGWEIGAELLGEEWYGGTMGEGHQFMGGLY